MAFVDWLQLAYVVEGVNGGPCARRNAEIVPSWNIPGTWIMLMGKKEIALPFLCPVELIIASSAGKKNCTGKQNLSWDLGDRKRFPFHFWGLNRLMTEISSACAEGWRRNSCQCRKTQNLCVLPNSRRILAKPSHKRIEMNTCCAQWHIPLWLLLRLEHEA